MLVICDMCEYINKHLQLTHIQPFQQKQIKTDFSCFLIISSSFSINYYYIHYQYIGINANY